MSATFQQYLARNNTTPAVDDNVLCIELGHTSSLLRYIGTDWNEIRISLRFAVSGSPSTGNMTNSYLFMGLCAGTSHRFSQTSPTSSFCMGYFSNSSFPYSSSTTFVGTTNAKTNPPNQNVYFQFANDPAEIGLLTTGSFAINGTGYSHQVPRIETQWTSSLPSNVYTKIGNNFSTFVLSVKKGSPWVLSIGSDRLSISPISSSCNYPQNSIKAAAFGALNISTGLRDALALFPVEQIGGAITDYWNQNWFGANVTPSATASLGDMDTLNIYYRCNTYPNSKLVIKDICISKVS